MQLKITALLLTAATAHAFEFGPGQDITSYIGLPGQIVPADLDDDGDLDLVVRNRLSPTILLYKNKGVGFFEQSGLWEATGGTSIRGVADFDADGTPDLLLASAPSVEEEESELKILFGSGLTGYGPRQTVLGNFLEHTLSTVVADVNVSGKPDVILLDRAFIDPGRDQALEVVMSHAEFAAYPQERLRWGDINGDDLPDALITLESTVYFAHNEGGGKFSDVFPLTWEGGSEGSPGMILDLRVVEDTRLPFGWGLIVLVTNAGPEEGEEQRVALVTSGTGGQVVSHSLPIASSDVSGGTSALGFTQTPGKPLLASLFNWKVLQLPADHVITSNTGSAVEIDIAFRRGGPVLVKKTRLTFRQGADPIVQADLNDDNIDDLVTASWRNGDTHGGQLRYYPGSRGGIFSKMGVAITGTPTDDTATHVTDFDGDGDKDLIGLGFSIADNSGEVVLWENLGAGVLRRGPIVTGLQHAEIVSIADRNGDSRPDLLLSSLVWNTKKNTGERTLQLVLSGKGTKRRTQVLYSEPGEDPWDQVRTGDWDGDSAHDILLWETVVENGGGEIHPVRWLKWLSANRFDTPRTLGNGFYETLQDMDGDGDLDLVPSRNAYNRGAVQDGWRENVGTATPVFHEFPAIAGIEGFHEIVSAEVDLNGDGRTDLLSIAEDEEGLFYRPVTLGAGLTFTALPSLPSGTPWFHDMEGDGDLDVLLATRPPGYLGTHGLAALENTGSLNFAAATTIEETTYAAWKPVLAGDLNGDGKTDVIASTVERRPRIKWFKGE